MIEIERKFNITPTQKNDISKYLQENSDGLETLDQTDQVFLQGINSFNEFTRGMPVVRLRTANNETTLAYKRSINAAGDTVEHELSIDSVETMRAILEEMDYRLVTEVSKKRTATKIGELAIMIDSVRGLGDFLEIEILAPDTSHQEDAEKQIMDQASKFGLGGDDIETRKYDELISARDQ